MDRAKRGLMTSVIAMCLMVVPFWSFMSAVGLPLRPYGPYAIDLYGVVLAMLFVPPIVSGFYAGTQIPALRRSVYACLLASTISVIIVSVVDVVDIFVGNEFSANRLGLFWAFYRVPVHLGICLGLQAIGVVPALILRRHQAGGAGGPDRDPSPSRP